MVEEYWPVLCICQSPWGQNAQSSVQCRVPRETCSTAGFRELGEVCLGTFPGGQCNEVVKDGESKGQVTKSPWIKSKDVVLSMLHNLGSFFLICKKGLIVYPLIMGIERVRCSSEILETPSVE